MKGANADQDAGIGIVRRAIQAPLRQIAENAGQNGAVVVGRILAEKKAAYGYDALRDEFCDLVKAGVIDPTKVVRSALQNAASVAALLLTTDALIAEVEEEKEESPEDMEDMGDMDY